LFTMKKNVKPKWTDVNHKCQSTAIKTDWKPDTTVF
jgi:hypothetical protein